MNADPDFNGLVSREGGYVDNPADRGGPTMYGITEHRARAYGWQGAMRDLPLTVALTIYRKDYWAGPGFDQVATRTPRLAGELFDIGVNMGPKTAATFLQRALNVLNRGGSDYPDINPDGDVGDLTLHALDGLIARRAASAEPLLLRAVDCLQGAHYIEIAEKNPSQEAFEAGWLGRVGAAA